MQRIELNEALIDAARAGDAVNVGRLLRKGAEVNYSDEFDYTALAYAAENNHVEVVKRILKEENVETSEHVSESEDAIGGTPLHIAAFRGYDEIVRLLVMYSPDELSDIEYCGYTPLHETILNKQYSTFRLLLQLSASYEDETVGSDYIPDGLDALGLIMHQLLEENEKIILIKMLLYLVRNFDVALPKRKYFKENQRSQALYELIKKYYIDDPDSLFKELLKFANIDAKKLIEVSREGAYGDYQELSDSDSEDALSYQYDDPLLASKERVESDIEKTFEQSSSKTLVPHFRGVHFYPSYFKYKDKRLESQVVEEQAKGTLPMQAMFCAAAHELADVPYNLPESPDLKSKDTIDTFKESLSERTKRLEAQSEKIISAVQAMQNQKDVEPCLQRKTQKRTRYESRYHEFIQRYVNSYATLLKDMKTASEVDIDKVVSKQQKEKYIFLKRLGFNKLPFISTTEDVHWAFEYAFSLVCYDKQTMFRPTTKTSVQPLRPCYLPNGQPRFPYLGVVYATLHLDAELRSGMSERVLDLFAEGAIDTRCAAPGGHITGGYIRAKERIFVNSIDAGHVFVAMMVRVPNLYHPYRSYIKDKYGLTEAEFNKFKADLMKSGSEEHGPAFRNEKQFYRTQLKIIEQVIAYQQEELLSFLAGCAKTKNYALKMLGSEEDELVEPTIRDEKSEKSFIKRFIDQREQSKMPPKAPLAVPEDAMDLDEEEPKSLSSSQSIFGSSVGKKRPRDDEEKEDKSASKRARME